MTVANKVYKFRIYPNEEQKVLFAKTFGCVRFMYNALLDDYIETKEKDGKGKVYTPAKYKEGFVWLKEVDSLALCNAQQNLKQALKNHFENPQHFEFPQFKKKSKSKKCYETNLVNGNIKVFDDAIVLPKVGRIKMKKHRKLPADAVLKGVAVSQSPTGKYYASLLFEYENQVEKRTDLNKSIGFDMTLRGLCMDSNGVSAMMPEFYRRKESKLAKEQAKLSKLHVKGAAEQSKRYYKQKLKVAKLYEKTANQRKDFLHKLSRSLVSEYDYIFVEDLNMEEMKQDDHGKSVSEIGWHTFVNFLQYKADMYGCNFIKVDKYFASTQICSACGTNTGKKDISIREWMCPYCNTHHDRDHNSAINVLLEGKRMVLSACV